MPNCSKQIMVGVYANCNDYNRCLLKNDLLCNNLASMLVLQQDPY